MVSLVSSLVVNGMFVTTFASLATSARPKAGVLVVSVTMLFAAVVASVVRFTVESGNSAVRAPLRIAAST